MLEWLTATEKSCGTYQLSSRESPEWWLVANISLRPRRDWPLWCLGLDRPSVLAGWGPLTPESMSPALFSSLFSFSPMIYTSTSPGMVNQLPPVSSGSSPMGHPRALWPRFSSQRWAEKPIAPTCQPGISLWDHSELLTSPLFRWDTGWFQGSGLELQLHVRARVLALSSHHHVP